MLVFWFIVASSLLNLLLFVIWANKDWVNVFIKLVFFVITFMGAYILITTPPNEMVDQVGSQKQIVK